MRNDPFHNREIRQWFFEEKDFYCDSFLKGVVTTGSGPFIEEDFDYFLNFLNIKTYEPNENLEILIVGRNNWDKEIFDQHFRKRKGKSIKVYTHEMVMAYIACGKDPCTEYSIFKLFDEDHPALGYITYKDYPLYKPKPEPKVAKPSDPYVNLPQVGMLKIMGYSVGTGGKNVIERQKILHGMFTSILPNVISREYMEQWGKPQSQKRLLKLANSIATFTRNAKHKNDKSLQEAITEWEHDLAWLKEKIYKGHFRFPWPFTYVRGL